MSKLAKRPNRKIGRPSIYSDELAAKICKFLADGETLTSICKRKGMPSRETVNVWRRERQDFSDEYARARELQADYYTEEILRVCDDASKAESNVEVQAARLKVDSLKWLASKLHPRIYGDKIGVAHVGKITHEFGSMTDDELDTLITEKGGDHE